MKKFGLSLLYVFSVVLAVGLGMKYSVNVEPQIAGSAKADCKIDKSSAGRCTPSCGTYDLAITGTTYSSAKPLSTSDHMKQCYSLTNSICNTASGLKSVILWDNTGCSE